MITLQSELDRLYNRLAPDGRHPPGAATDLIAPDGRVRALVLALARPADWALMSVLWRGVQTDLELPAPAIAVSGIDAYQLWFSLAEPVSLAQAKAFLESLRLRYLGQIEPGRLSIRPWGDAANQFCAVRLTLFRMKFACMARDPLHDQFRFLIYPNCHASL